MGGTRSPHVEPVDTNAAIVSSASCAATVEASVQSVIPPIHAKKPQRVRVKAVRYPSFAATPPRAPLHVDRHAYFAGTLRREPIQSSRVVTGN
ncbi:hypothetical protein ACOSQ2_005255 [Xanthoceras sorbifolium]